MPVACAQLLSHEMDQYPLLMSFPTPLLFLALLDWTKLQDLFCAIPQVTQITSFLNCPKCFASTCMHVMASVCSQACGRSSPSLLQTDDTVMIAGAPCQHFLVHL